MTMGDNAARDRSVEFQLAVMGTGPVGNTSLINALLGHTFAETGATIGTTCGSHSHSYVIEAFERDRPGRDADGLMRTRLNRSCIRHASLVPPSRQAPVKGRVEDGHARNVRHPPRRGFDDR
jgi:GTPase SAR1 family protein